MQMRAIRHPHSDHDQEMTDLRPLLFDGLPWYNSLEEPSAGVESAWYTIKGYISWGGPLLSVAAGYAREKGLLATYRERFRQIAPHDLTPAAARSAGRKVTDPIWSIANELIVACYLERVLRWRFVAHDPPGRDNRVGDWLFDAPSGRRVFVEVKSPDEPNPAQDSGAHCVPVRAARVRKLVSNAYGQLPKSDCATLVVIVGEDLVRIQGSLVYGDVFQSLFGALQLSFTVESADPSPRLGPSFRDMLVHRSKHRELGCIAGMHVSGFPEKPRLLLYAIDNPFARPGRRIPPPDLLNARRFVFDEAGRGEEFNGISLGQTWRRMQQTDVSSAHA
jgi:hypothetical protein